MTVHAIPLIATKIGNLVIAVPLTHDGGGGGSGGGGGTDTVSLDDIDTYVFPTGYYINSTAGLQLHRESDGQLIGRSRESAIQPSLSSDPDFYEFIQQPVTFFTQDIDGIPNGTPMEKTVSWRQPKEGKPYWRYTEFPPNYTYTTKSTDKIDCVHVMSGVHSAPQSVHRLQFVDESGIPAVVSVYINYYSFTKTYQLTLQNGAAFKLEDGATSSNYEFRPDAMLNSDVDTAVIVYP